MSLTANPYLEVDEAQTYFDGRLNADAWDCVSNADRHKALVQSTRSIDRLNFFGSKTESDQELEFPRNGSEDIPTAIKVAVCENALALLDGIDIEVELRLLNSSSQSYTGIRETYDRSFVAEHLRAGIASGVAWTYIYPYLADPHQLKFSRV